jgi:hypothetical protein
LHPPKARAGTFADTVQASGAFSQLPRVGLLFGYHPADLELPREEQRRVVLRGKGNVGRNPRALAYRIAERNVELDDGDSDLIGYVADVEPCDVTERELLSTGRPQAPDEEREPSKAEQVEAIILERFGDGQERPSIYEELRGRGFAHTTVERARKALCTTRKEPGEMGRGWLWTLRPEHVRSTHVSLVHLRASRGGSLQTDTDCVPSGVNPNETRRDTDTHERDEIEEHSPEETHRHNSGGTTRVREGSLAQRAVAQLGEFGEKR